MVTTSLEYIEIDDPAFKATFEERGQLDYVLVRPRDFSNIPVTRPNWEPEPCCLNWRYQKVGQQIKEMEVRPDDIWLTGYPKSGTTWCQEMIWLICNDLDYEKAASLSIMRRFPTLEMGGLRDLPEDLDPIKAIVSMSSPRLIKTHLPVGLLPDQMWKVKPRLVHVRRNPKSVAVSYYHHMRRSHVDLNGYNASMDEYLESFMKGQIHYLPYHSHVADYYNLDYQGHILYLCYEDMKKDLKGELRRVCLFFGKTYSDEQLNTLAEHLSFDKLKNNKSVNMSDLIEVVLKLTNRADKLDDENFKFVRKGKSDGWKTELSAEQQQQLDEWTRAKILDPEQLKLFQ